MQPLWRSGGEIPDVPEELPLTGRSGLRRATTSKSCRAKAAAIPGNRSSGAGHCAEVAGLTVKSIVDINDSEPARLPAPQGLDVR